MLFQPTWGLIMHGRILGNIAQEATQQVGGLVSSQLGYVPMMGLGDFGKDSRYNGVQDQSSVG